MEYFLTMISTSSDVFTQKILCCESTTESTSIETKLPAFLVPIVFLFHAKSSSPTSNLCTSSPTFRSNRPSCDPSQDAVENRAVAPFSLKNKITRTFYICKGLPPMIPGVAQYIRWNRLG